MRPTSFEYNFFHKNSRKTSLTQKKKEEEEDNGKPIIHNLISEG